MNQADYVVKSEDIHLFFSRIMMEHALFLEASFPQVEKSLIKEASYYRNEFAKILMKVIKISDGFFNEKLIKSNELVTNYTLILEEKTQKLTGIRIDTNLTLLQQELKKGEKKAHSTSVINQLHQINYDTKIILESFIKYIKEVLDLVLTCKIISFSYPLMIDHLIEEAKLYLAYVNRIEMGKSIEVDPKGQERFWNEIMMEHALFIRGILDPSEKELISLINDYVTSYKELLTFMGQNTNFTLTNEAINRTNKFEEFKDKLTAGISKCNIKTIGLPIFFDHILREANHYLRILKENKQ